MHLKKKATVVPTKSDSDVILCLQLLSKTLSCTLHLDVASDVGVNLCNVKSCLNTSNNEIFTDKRGDLPCVNISKHACPVVK